MPGSSARDAVVRHCAGIARRPFVFGALVVLATPELLHGQQADKQRCVVVLGVGVNSRSEPFFVAFERRLRELGYIEGQSFALEYRSPERGTSLDDIAREVAREPVDVIVVTGPEPPLAAAWKATRQIPIVKVAINYDPVQRGYVTSLGRPGGNVTGVSYQQLEVSSKQLELLTTVVPGTGRIGVLWESYSADQLQAVEAAARTLGAEVLPVEVRPPYDYERAFAVFRGARPRGVLVLGSPVFYRDRARIHGLARRDRLPTTGTLVYADAGALLAYGPDLSDLYRRAAEYVDRVLKGARPGDLPVEQPTSFRLVINLRTARALGLAIPQSLLLRADQVIE